MTDRPTRWPETPDIVIRLRARREAWTCIRDEAASEIEKLRKANLRLLGEVSRLTADIAIAVEALEIIADCHDSPQNDEVAAEALAKIKENTK